MNITHPEKLMFPRDGIRKHELAAYYVGVAPFMLPHVRGRPVTMERFPAGIDQKGFIQKDLVKGFPDWVQRVEVPKKGGSVHHLLLDSAEALAWMANQNCITPHVWTSRAPALTRPDLCVFDLDPSTDDAAALRAVALELRALLEQLGFDSWVKTSGSKGFHIVVPLDGSADFEQVWQFAHTVGALLVKRDPERVTQEFIKSDRAGRLLIDTGRNGYSATFATAYAVRAKNGAPVSAPCTWDEVESGAVAPQSFTLRNMAERMESAGDLWADMRKRGRALTRAIARLRKLASVSAD